MSGGDIQAMASEESLFREMLDGYLHGLAIFDADARMIYGNPALAKHNPQLADLFEIGLEWDSLLRELIARGAMDRQEVERLRAQETALDSGRRGRIKLPVGYQGIHEFALTPLSNGGFIFFQEDVTDREMAEEQDREADALLRQVLEACPANLVMSRVDDGQIIYRSPAARDLLGPAKKVREHFVNQTERADFITALLPEGRVDDAVLSLRTLGGEIFPALVSSRIIEYRGEDVAVSSLVDISKEVEMRKMLAAQRERIFETEKMSALGELLAGVAHELNNPLSVVVGHALMLREETTDPEILRRVEQIETAAERCAKIVKSFLAMAREQKVAKEAIGLGDLVNRAIGSIAEGEVGFSLAVEQDIPGDAPELCGDPGQLEQVFTNLLVNAQQATANSGKAGKVTIAASPDRVRKLMVIDFRDNGPGISAHIGKRVFEPLFTTKEVGQGTGIGLAFCHRVLTAHGGSIELMASESGAHFRIHLPLADIAEEGDAGDARKVAEKVRGTVLVIDDERDVAALVSEILRRDGFAVDTVHSGEDGLVAVGTKDFDAILVDIKMPGIGGQGFFEDVRHSRPELVGRIAFVTGSTMSPETRGFIDNSGCRFLEKPAAPKDIRALAREIAGGTVA